MAASYVSKCTICYCEKIDGSEDDGAQMIPQIHILLYKHLLFLVRSLIFQVLCVLFVFLLTCVVIAIFLDFISLERVRLMLGWVN